MRASGFGVTGDGTGAIWTRTGRAFFADENTTEEVLARLRAAADRIGLWDELATDWLLLDAEIMPWSAKAGAPDPKPYAPVAISSHAGLAAANEALLRASARGVPVGALRDRFLDRAQRAGGVFARMVALCVAGLGCRRSARRAVPSPCERSRVWFDRDHVWHMELADRLSDDAIVAKTRWMAVDLADEAASAAAIGWWEEQTANGGEGMVVKPRAFVPRGEKGLLQPALKVRGREYLRIIYGPEYDAPDNLSRLRARGVGGKAQPLRFGNLRLGHEALKRFAAREPLRRIHECVFGVLALESEPIDPRL